MLIVAPYLYETPFNHWIVYSALFVGVMYAVALVQHHIHWRRSRRG